MTKTVRQWVMELLIDRGLQLVEVEMVLQKNNSASVVMAMQKLRQTNQPKRKKVQSMKSKL
jgi:hypothetical protein